MENIYVTKPFMPPLEEYIEEIKEIWENKQLTNGGQKHQKLEQELKRYLGVENITLFSNGHTALEGTLRAFNLTGEVITTPFTFASTTSAIVRCGLKPVFCDVESERYTIDADKIEALITPRTSAIVPVHVYGNVCDVEKIEQIAKKHNLKVIYDGAHAFGVKIGEKGIAQYGDATIFSFHATKIFSTGEGGAVVCRDSRYKEILEKQKNFGIGREGTVDLWGGNAKMSEFHAAYGLCALRHMEEAFAERKRVCETYMRYLAGKEGITIPSQREGATCNYAYFPVVFDGVQYTCEDVLTRLRAEGINARRYFYPLTSEFSCWEKREGEANTPVAKYVSERVLCLPFYPELSDADTERICRVVLKK